MANFYLLESLQIATVGDTVTVDGPEARHAVTVSRLKSGDAVLVGNGSGLVVGGTVLTADASEFTLAAASVTTTPAPAPGLWIAQALAKGDRDELAVQAATELGVDGVIPWAAQRSIVKWEGAKVSKGQERWSAIVREASKQSIRAWVPEVSPPVSSKQLAALGSSTRLVVLDPTSDRPLTALVPDDGDDTVRDTVVVVGPEGGITPQELDLFDAVGAERVRLGSTILRTSTAGPAAIAVLNARLHRW